jgi:hypothetical protein
VKYLSLVCAIVSPFVVMKAQDVQSMEGTGFSEAIEDNSFFIEEAYNQEEGVVQHISTLTFFRSPSRDMGYSLTQEWPLWSQSHQLSFTVPYASLGGGTVTGVNDMLINYRYQLTDSRNWATLSPRLSILLPTGNEHNGLGAGVFGVQFNLPVSKRLANALIAHANVGITLLPGVKGSLPSGDSVEKTLAGYNAGVSVIVLAEPWVNFLVEGNVTVLEDLVNGGVEHSTEYVVSPGVRMAFDIGSLQIVPGLGIPFMIADGATHAGVFFYLSFEHPF